MSEEKKTDTMENAGDKENTENSAKEKIEKEKQKKKSSGKSTKILIGVILVLAVVIAVLAVVIVKGGKEKKKEKDTAMSETTESTTQEAASASDAEESGETSEEQQEKTANCYVTITNSNKWESNGKYSGQLDARITNNSANTLKNWSIEIDVPEGTTVDSFWNSNCVVENNVLKVTPVDYNGEIPANGSLGDIGLIVTMAKESGLSDLTKNPRLYIDGQLYTDTEGAGQEQTTEEKTTEEAKEPVAPESGTPFDNHGKLAVSGTDLVDEHGDKYQLKGVSTHGIAWFPDYVNKDAFQTFRDDWGANLIRIAMYSDENGGYCSGGDQEYLKGLVDTGVQAATELGMYCIVDWHVLGDQNPQVHKEEAKAFFEEMTAKYKNYDNIIYEICNEPNGGTTWSDVKSYAEEVIPIIRKNCPDAIIIVGTPNWSQDVDIASQDPITGYDNIMYAIHFYAATHTENIRNKATTAIGNGLPIFVSEFSICDASGNGAIDYNQADLWFDLIDQYNLSYAGWNVSNKDETSSLIKSSCTKTSGWTESDLSETGIWLRNQIKGTN